MTAEDHVFALREVRAAPKAAPSERTCDDANSSSIGQIQDGCIWADPDWCG